MAATSEKTDQEKRMLDDFQEFERTMNGLSASTLHRLRKESIARFKDLGFPTRKSEEWKYTNIAPFLKSNYKQDFSSYDKSPDIPDLNKEKIFWPDAITCTFINGRFSEALSDLRGSPKGCIIGNLSDQHIKNKTLINAHFAKYAKFDKDAFIALNTAFVNNGAFIYIPDETIVERPVHIFHLISTGQENILSQPRNLVITGKNTGLSIVESFVTQGEKNSFTNEVSEILVGENSKVAHYLIQSTPANLSEVEQTISNKNARITSTHVHQEKESEFTGFTITIGGEMIRNNLVVVLNAEGCETKLFGLYLTKNRDHVDNHTLIDHTKPNCHSSELYKGIINDHSVGVFNGKVIVRENAQKTNAFQSNKNILLSDDAAINTKPQLEIFADDVKCSHGATSGQLNEDAMFYLQTRGISAKKARTMLLQAFTDEIIENIPDKELQDYLEKTTTILLENS